MGKSTARGVTPATLVLDAAGIGYAVRAYRHEAGEDFGRAAAAALGVEADRVFKTLVTRLDGDLVVAIVPVSAMVDLKALAAAQGAKRAVLADPAEAQRSTGYVIGGISPIGQRTVLPAVLDSSARAHGKILVSGGRRGLDVEIAPADLVAVTGAAYAAVSRLR